MGEIVKTRIRQNFVHAVDKYLLHWSKEWHFAFDRLTWGIVSLCSVASGFVVSTLEELWSTTASPGCWNCFCIYLECRVWTINVSFWNCCTSPITHDLDLTCSVSSICHECCLSPSHWMWCEMFIILATFVRWTIGLAALYLEMRWTFSGTKPLGLTH